MFGDAPGMDFLRQVVCILVSRLVSPLSSGCTVLGGFFWKACRVGRYLVTSSGRLDRLADTLSGSQSRLAPRDNYAFFGQWAIIGSYLWGIAAGTFFLAHVAVIFLVFYFYGLEFGAWAYSFTSWLLGGYCLVASSSPAETEGWWITPTVFINWFGISLLLYPLGGWLWERTSGRKAALETQDSSDSVRVNSPRSPEDLFHQLNSGEWPKITVRRRFHVDAEPERFPVDCTVFAPDRVRRNQQALLQVFLHAPGDQMLAEATARQFDAGTKPRGHRSLVLDAAIGTTFTFDCRNRRIYLQ
jgi:hypothetical protein